MLSSYPRPSIRRISDPLDPHPAKRAKTAAVGRREAAGGRTKAERWFNDTNNNAFSTKDVPYLDNDPPFYLNGTTHSGGGSACAVHSDGSSFNPSNLGQPTAPTRSLLAQMDANESHSEDFRGVIDDLTIQNKRLRKKLKQYERLHCSHLQEEKLFEVRIHGLAPHRKRELEEILRSFASSTEEMPETTLFDIGDYRASAPALVDHKPPSSSTSCSKGSKPIDSAYASMSGMAGISQKQSQDRVQQDRLTQSQSRQQNVESYLHDMPQTLVPKNSLGMSEKAKSRLVVRRLEQIFTGRRAAPHNSQSHQQQKVSQSAAQADRPRFDAGGRRIRPIREGVREARILPSNAELKVDSLSEANLAAQQSQQSVGFRGRYPRKEGIRDGHILLTSAESQIDSSSDTHLTGQQSRQSTDGEDSRSWDPRTSRGVSPNQRPTRPIDLDLHRAQVPSDNIEYIRHLGLASPTATLNVKPESDDGWVFLNLLISMAQLHTLNVTPEFIRHAVAEVSTKFELSADGTKVRWQGGTDGTQMSSDSDDSDGTGNWRSTDTSVSVSKGGSIAGVPGRVAFEEDKKPNMDLPNPAINLPTAPEIGAKRRPVYLEQPNDVDRFQYKPLFFHAIKSEEDDDASAHGTNSVSSFDPMENATGLNSGSHGVRESEVKLRKQNRKNGPIIFYNKARFCTDLSGDSSGAMHDKAAYSRYVEEPMGCLEQLNAERSDESESRHISYGDNITESMDLDIQSTTTTRSALDLEDLRSSISDLSARSPIPMEVSGLGGIQPEDNFIVKVKVRHRGKEGQDLRSQAPLSRPLGQIGRLLHSTNILREVKEIPRSHPNRGTIKSEIISTVRTNMAPSSLPSPSYVCLPFSSSESDDGDDEDEDQDEDQDADADADIYCYNDRPRASAKSSVEDVVDARPADFCLGSSSDEEKESSYLSTSSGSDDDSSIDFLANARVHDPDTIAAQEREFEFNSVQQPAVADGIVSGQGINFGSAPPRSSRSVETESDVDSMIVDGDAEDD